MKRTFCLFLLQNVCATATWAQAGAGIVSGVVKEAGGDGIPETGVELTNPSLGLRRTMSTTDDGLFTAPALTPAAGYVLKLSHKNFVDWQSAPFEVTVGETVNFEVTLKYTPEAAKYDQGNIPEPHIARWTSSTATEITPSQLATLPAIHRQLEPLIALTPFASRDNTGRIVINAQARSNTSITDGILTSNTYLESRPGIAPHLTLDSVEEFQVLTGGFAPEFGDTRGGIVNLATRSGGGTLHGTLYDYLDPSGWNASGRYGLGQTQLNRQNQFGAAVGGAIWPPKLFYFVNGEVWNGSGTGLNRITTQTLADPFGLGIATANCKATAAQCAGASAFLQKQMNVPVALSGHTATGLAKIDYRRSDRNQFTFAGDARNGRSPAGPLDQVAPNGGLLGLPEPTEQIRYGKAGWTSAPTTSSVNELRFGIFQDRISEPAAHPGLATRDASILLAGVSIGNPRPNGTSLAEHRYQLVENITSTSNTHTFRAGADLWQNTDFLNAMNVSGLYVYNSLTAFATDLATSGHNYSYLTQTFGTPARKLEDRQYNLYAMDTWRPVPKLTIVAGVRWEKAHRQQPADANTNYFNTGSIAAPIIDFAPRISLAYQADPRTVLHFGYSWVYEPLPGRAIDALYLGNGIYQTDVTVNPNQTGAPFFPNPLPANTIPAGAADLIYGQSKFRDIRLQQYTASIERSLARNTTLALTGVREKGAGLWTLTDVNLAPPAVTKTYAVDDAAGAQINTYSPLLYTSRLDTRYAHVYNAGNGGSYWHTALGVELRHRMSHGLTAQASYTWSHAIDDTSGPTVGGVFPISVIAAGTSDRAASAYDRRHNLTVNWTWQPSVGAGPLRAIVNGWAVSGIVTAASGLPLTPLAIVAGQQFSGATMTYTTTLNGSDGWARVPFQPIGSLMTERQFNLDARVSRTITFTERIKATVLFEAFNALNSQYNIGLNTVAFQAIPTAPPAGAVNGPFTGVIHTVPGAGSGNVANEARRAQAGFRLSF